MADEGKVAVTGEKPATPEPVRHPVDVFRREFDRLFDDFTTGFSGWPFARRGEAAPAARAPSVFANTPAVDVAEKDSAYEITAELPGLDEKDIEVQVADDVLTIKGEKSEAKEEKKKDYYLAERRYGTFQRAFRLPQHVDAGKIDASFKNGVLTIMLPKTAEAQQKQRKIEIRKQ
ncbi:MAG: Hsp20/alpha crystallin family protein [Rhodospirillales bacterium]